MTSQQNSNACTYYNHVATTPQVEWACTANLLTGMVTGDCEFEWWPQAKRSRDEGKPDDDPRRKDAREARKQVAADEEQYRLAKEKEEEAKEEEEKRKRIKAKEKKKKKKKPSRTSQYESSGKYIESSQIQRIQDFPNT